VHPASEFPAVHSPGVGGFVSTGSLSTHDAAPAGRPSAPLAEAFQELKPSHFLSSRCANIMLRSFRTPRYSSTQSAGQDYTRARREMLRRMPTAAREVTSAVTSVEPPKLTNGGSAP